MLPWAQLASTCDLAVPVLFVGFYFHGVRQGPAALHMPIVSQHLTLCSDAPNNALPRQPGHTQLHTRCLRPAERSVSTLPEQEADPEPFTCLRRWEPPCQALLGCIGMGSCHRVILQVVDADTRTVGSQHPGTPAPHHMCDISCFPEFAVSVMLAGQQRRVRRGCIIGTTAGWHSLYLLGVFLFFCWF